MNNLEVYIKGKFPLLFINTKETNRAMDNLLNFIKEFNNNIKHYDLPLKVKEFGFKSYVWDMINGLVEVERFDEDGIYTSVQDRKTIDLINALDEIKTNSKLAGFYIFKNIDVVLNIKYGSSGRVPIFTHILSHYKLLLQEQLKWIVFIGDIQNIPNEIKSLFTLIDFELPNENDIRKYIEQIIKECQIKNTNVVQLVEACKGMTLQEIDEAIRVSIIKNNGETIDIDSIYKEKANAVKKSSFLEYIPYNFGLENVGGMDILKSEIKKISRIYNNIDKAKSFGLSMPKGILLIGIAGTGKTLASKAISKELNLPLFRADISALFGGIVGETERNTREFFKLIKAVSPAVIQIDEIEKAFSGSGFSGASDGGVTDRLVGNFLTYMQERDYPCFFVATCNDIKSLPSPFVRKGRWDEIFFIDLPNLKEREEILQIKIKQTGRKTDKFNINELAINSEGLTGAEIESAIQEALRIAFYENRDINQMDIINSLTKTKGILHLKYEEINYIREWAKDRAKTASSSYEIEFSGQRRKKMIN